MSNGDLSFARSAGDINDNDDNDVIVDRSFGVDDELDANLGGEETIVDVSADQIPLLDSSSLLVFQRLSELLSQLEMTC